MPFIGWEVFFRLIAARVSPVPSDSFVAGSGDFFCDAVVVLMDYLPLPVFFNEKGKEYKGVSIIRSLTRWTEFFYRLLAVAIAIVVQIAF